MAKLAVTKMDWLLEGDRQMVCPITTLGLPHPYEYFLPKDLGNVPPSVEKMVYLNIFYFSHNITEICTKLGD